MLLKTEDYGTPETILHSDNSVKGLGFAAIVTLAERQ